MRLLLLVASLIVALAAASVAEGKEFTRLVAVGDHGRSVAFQGQQFAPWNLAPSRIDALPTGRFILLYPMLDRAVVGEPGRYYPEQRIACFSWNRAIVGDCSAASTEAAAELDRAGVPQFTREPTILSRLWLFGRERRLDSNGAVAIELAFNRWRLALRHPHRPADCFSLQATWSGPAAATRPSRFCLAIAGVWWRGRLYPAPHTLEQL
jgi:hypothetical protein